MKILFLYGYEPSGHATAAHALEEQFRISSPSDQTHCINLSSDVHPILGPAVAKAYLKIIQKTPTLWEYLYDNQKVAEVTEDLKELFFFLGGGKLRNQIRKINPDVIVCTHALSCNIIAFEKEKGNISCPIVAVLTDFAVHTYWIHPQVDMYLVPASDTANQLTERRIPEEKIRITGMPIPPTFQKPMPPEIAKQKWDIPSSSSTLLISGGSKGLGSLEQMTEILAQKLPLAQILVSCGNNHQLLKNLKTSFNKASSVRVFPYLPIESFKELMCAADLLIGKAGGLTISQALALGKPILLFQPIPGQEEGNTEFLLRNDAATQAKNLTQLVEMAQALLNQKTRLERMSERASALGNPTSSHQSQEAILQLLQRLTPSLA
ncbi:MAG: hypothetical protein HY400_07610 [Elusimicrobia bacterium]|nr:hypothetical protein [Elusimicrobiota bacterium]